MNGELQNIRHLRVPPKNHSQELHHNAQGYLDNPNVGFLTESRPPVAEMSPRNFEGWLWDSLEYVCGIVLALLGGLLLFSFLMGVWP